MGEIDGSLGHRLGPEMLKGIMIHLLPSFFWIPEILAGKRLTTCTGSQVLVLVRQTGLRRPTPNPDRLHISPHKVSTLIGVLCVLKIRRTRPTRHCSYDSRTLELMDINDKKLVCDL